LHGHRSTRANHGDYCDRLARAGISALALDLRGHGDSEGVTDAGMPGDVTVALDALHERGAGALGVRGSSLGG
jgi:alpha-beta hydrolase superfamily lysophospholipase